MCRLFPNHLTYQTMRKLFILLAVLTFINSNGQDKKKQEDHQNFSIGFSFSPNYNYRTLENKDAGSVGEMIIDNRNKFETGKLGFSTGANVNFKLTRKFELQTGLFYSDKGYKTSKQPLDFPSPSPDEPTHFSAKYYENYLDIPLKLNYISGKGRLKFIAGAGLSANFFLNASGKTTLFYSDGREEERGKKSSIVDYKKFNISALASSGLEYKLKENIFLRAEPTFRYGLLKIVDQPITERLWNVGLNVGVYLKLK